LPVPIVNGRGDRLGKVQFLELQKPLDLDLGFGHIYTSNFIEIGKTFHGWMDVRTYSWTFQTRSNVIRSTHKSRPN